MSDTVISVENLGKRYRIAHQAERQRYVALRDVIAEKAKGLFRRVTAKGKALSAKGDAVTAKGKALSARGQKSNALPLALSASPLPLVGMAINTVTYVLHRSLVVSSPPVAWGGGDAKRMPVSDRIVRG